MEERKNSQVQALDDDALEDVAGGWNAVIQSTEGDFGVRKESVVGFDLSNEEALKLIKAGKQVTKSKKGNYYICYLENDKDVESILGTKREANRYI